MFELATPHIKEKVDGLIPKAESKEDSQDEEAPAKVDLLTYLVLSGNYTLEEAVTNAIDMMNAGIDTV